jgi:hypothetical protein
MSNTIPPYGADKDKNAPILPPATIKSRKAEQNMAPVEETYAPGNYDYVTPDTERPEPVFVEPTIETYNENYVAPEETHVSTPVTDFVQSEQSVAPNHVVEHVNEKPNEPVVTEQVENKTVTSDFNNDSDDVFGNTDSFFENVPRTLTVNEQPFFRWFKRVVLALVITSLFVLGVSFYVKAPLELSIGAVASVWVVILAITAPEAIIPYKKTRFNLTDNTVRVGQKKPRPISEIKNASLNTDKKNVKLWLSFDDKKDGFFVPLQSSKITMKREDLLALRTIIPHTSISEEASNVEIDFTQKAKEVTITEPDLIDFIELKIDSLKK